MSAHVQTQFHAVAMDLESYPVVPDDESKENQKIPVMPSPFPFQLHPKPPSAISVMMRWRMYSKNWRNLKEKTTVFQKSGVQKHSLYVCFPVALFNYLKHGCCTWEALALLTMFTAVPWERSFLSLGILCGCVGVCNQHRDRTFWSALVSGYSIHVLYNVYV